MKKFIYTASLFLAGYVAVNAQQTIKLSNYLFNKTILNPAAAGSNEYYEFMGSYRSQWAGIEGAPSTAVLSADGVFLDRRLGAAVQVVDDRLGALQNTGIIGNLASRIRLSDTRWLSLGVAGGLFTSTLNGRELVSEDMDDAAFPSNSAKLNLMDFKAGIYYKDFRNFGGISVFNILEPKLNYTPTERAEEGVLARHYYAFVGRIFPLNNELAITPSVLFKSDEGGNYQFDVNAKLVYKNAIALGVAFRERESVGVMAEYIHNNIIRVGYAYDYTTNDYRNYQSGAHEIMLSFRIIQNKEIVENPRYFYN